MFKFLKIPILLCSSLALLLSAGGCEDSTAEARAEVQRNILQASQEFDTMVLSGFAPEDEQPLQKLNALLEELRTLPEAATAGQRQASALLASSIHEQIALLQLEKLIQNASLNRLQRERVGSALSTAWQLDAVAAAQEHLQLDQTRQMLEQTQHSASQRKQTEQETAVQLQQRISEVQQEIEKSRTTANQLNRESGEFKRKSLDAPAGEGFEDFRESVMLRREAERQQKQITDRNIELSGLTPRRDYAQTLASQQKALLDATDAAQQQLDQLTALSSEQAGMSRELVTTLRNRIRESFTAITEELFGPSAELYQSAAEHLSESASAANRAGGPGDMVAAGANQALGSLHATRARALNDHGVLLGNLLSIEGVFDDPSTFESTLEKLRTARDAAVEAATAAYNEALNALNSAGRTNAAEAVEATKTNINLAIQSLEGVEVDYSQMASGGASLDTSQPAATGQSASSAGGYTTPQELLTFVKSINPTDQQAVSRYLDAFQAESSQGQQLLSAYRNLFTAAIPLNKAIADEFGQGAFDQANEQMSRQMGMPNLQNATVTDQSGDRAAISISGGPTGQTKLPLIRTNDTWHLDADTMASQMGPALGQLQKSASVMKNVNEEFATHVRDGEFSSARQAMQAMLQEVMSRMAGGG